jgi:hypothetical protein
MSAATATTVAWRPPRARSTPPIAAPMSGVDCINVRRTPNTRPRMSSGTDRIRRVWAQMVMGEANTPARASVAEAIASVGTVSRPQVTG